MEVTVSSWRVGALPRPLFVASPGVGVAGAAAATQPQLSRNPGRAVLNKEKKKKCSCTQVSQLCPQWLAVGGWSPLAVGGSWRPAVGGSWRLLAVGGWRLMVPWGGP